MPFESVLPEVTIRATAPSCCANEAQWRQHAAKRHVETGDTLSRPYNKICLLYESYQNSVSWTPWGFWELFLWAQRTPFVSEQQALTVWVPLQTCWLISVTNLSVIKQVRNVIRRQPLVHNVPFQHVGKNTILMRILIYFSVTWVRERTIPTERPELVSEVSANFWG
jgi:hypothetical protein